MVLHNNNDTLVYVSLYFGTLPHLSFHIILRKAPRTYTNASTLQRDIKTLGTGGV